jgi:heme exporter protein CcmB
MAWGRGGGPVVAVAFYACVATLLPLAVGASPQRLAAVAPGSAWLALALASLLSLERLFERDYEDGALDLLALGPVPLEIVATAKCLAQWVSTGLPLAVFTPVAATALGARARLLGPIYRILALGWRGTPAQERALRRGVGIMAILIIPLAVSVHSVLALLFAVTARGGWHSTIFAPLFVLAAMLSGVAAVILVIAALRKVYGLQEFITAKHFRYLSYLLVALGLGYLYFMVSEYVTEGYLLDANTTPVLEAIFTGAYAPAFWAFSVGGLVFPLVLAVAPGRFPIARAGVASTLVVAGMWLKRFLIVVPGMAEPIMPWDWGRYSPTWVEVTITIGSAAAIPLILIVFFRFFPVMSVHEMDEVESSEEQPSAALRPAYAGAGDD